MTRQRTGNGLGVDASGAPAVDPTENVKALTDAEARRQDDLREAHMRFVDAEIAHVKEIVTLRALHATELTAKESGRLDAIRQVDQLNVSTAAGASAAAIATLATTTTTTADTLRNAVVASAQAIATQNAAGMASLTERISALEKGFYEGKGKSTISDPMFTELMTEMKAMRGSQNTTTGQTSGTDQYRGLIFQLAPMVIAVAAIVFALVK